MAITLLSGTRAYASSNTVNWDVANCMACHTGYPANHSLTGCTSCHSAWVGPESHVFTPDRPAGSCLGGTACHTGPNPALWQFYQHGRNLGYPPFATDYFPESPISFYMTRPSIMAADRRVYTCDFCHSPAYPSIFRHTAANMAAAHVSDIAGTDCERCHSNALELDPGHPTCDTCHASTHPRVVNAITTGQTGCGSCHRGIHGRTWSYPSFYSWGSEFNTLRPGAPLLSQIGDNPLFPGVHANYTANTAKCGVCHSVHRAVAGGVSLLPSANNTCAGCHVGGATPITRLNVTWGAGPGPHGSESLTTCATRACHLANPHGVGSSQYAIVAQMLLNPATDAVLAAAVANPVASGITLAQLNATEPAATAWTESTRSAVRTGYNCNIAGCHVQTLLTVLRTGWAEQRKASYALGADFVGPAGIPPYTGPGPYGVSAVTGADPFKTGHRTVAAASYADTVSFAPVTGCVSCHDQTDAFSTSGFTFPHGQVPLAWNQPAGSNTTATTAAASRAWLWMTMAENTAGADYQWMDDETDKAMDGACLKCHRSVTSGVGLTR